MQDKGIPKKQAVPLSTPINEAFLVFQHHLTKWFLDSIPAFRQWCFYPPSGIWHHLPHDVMAISGKQQASNRPGRSKHRWIFCSSAVVSHPVIHEKTPGCAG